MASNSQQTPDGAITIPTDPITGLLTKAGEIYRDVAVARAETRVAPAAVTPQIPGTTKGTTPPGAAMPGTAGPVPILAGLSPAMKTVLFVGAIGGTLALVYFIVARRK